MEEKAYKFRLIYETIIEASSEEEAYELGCEMAQDMIGNGCFDEENIVVKPASKRDLKKQEEEENKEHPEPEPEKQPTLYATVTIGKKVQARLDRTNRE